MKKNRHSNPVALVPILVFLVLYLGTGIIFEYVMKIPMGFYNVPIIVAFMAAILVACMQNSQLKFFIPLDIVRITCTMNVGVIPVNLIRDTIYAI